MNLPRRGIREFSGFPTGGGAGAHGLPSDDA